MQDVGSGNGVIVSVESFGGGNGGQKKKCKGASFNGKKIPPVEELVTARVADMQPVRKHMDDKDKENGTPQSIHVFGSVVCFAGREIICVFFLDFVQVQSDNLQMRQNHKAIPPIPVDNVRERMVQVERMDISVESKNGKDDIEMAPAGADVRKSVCCGDCEHGDWFLIASGRKFHGRYWR